MEKASHRADACPLTVYLRVCFETERNGLLFFHSHADERVLVIVPARGRPIGLKRMKTVQRAARRTDPDTRDALVSASARDRLSGRPPNNDMYYIP